MKAGGRGTITDLMVQFLLAASDKLRKFSYQEESWQANLSSFVALGPSSFPAVGIGSVVGRRASI